MRPTRIMQLRFSTSPNSGNLGGSLDVYDASIRNLLADVVSTRYLNNYTWFRYTFAACKGGMGYSITGDKNGNIDRSEFTLGYTIGGTVTLSSAKVLNTSENVPARIIVPYYNQNIFVPLTSTPNMQGSLAITCHCRALAGVTPAIDVYQFVADDFSFGMQVGPPHSTTSFIVA